jgi:hypothetical protein
VTPVTVTVDDAAGEGPVAVGVYETVAVQVARGFTVTEVFDIPESENCGLEGGVTESAAGALPSLMIVTVCGVDGCPTRVVGNVIVPELPSREKTAPVGVTVSGIETLAVRGSLMKRLNDPRIVVPADE